MVVVRETKRMMVRVGARVRVKTGTERRTQLINKE